MNLLDSGKPPWTAGGWGLPPGKQGLPLVPVRVGSLVTGFWAAPHSCLLQPLPSWDFLFLKVSSGHMGLGGPSLLSLWGCPPCAGGLRAGGYNCSVISSKKGPCLKVHVCPGSRGGYVLSQGGLSLPWFSGRSCTTLRLPWFLGATALLSLACQWKRAAHIFPQDALQPRPADCPVWTRGEGEDRPEVAGGIQQGMLGLVSSGWGSLAPLVGALLCLEFVSGPAMVMGPPWGLVPVIYGCADPRWAQVTGCRSGCQSGWGEGHRGCHLAAGLSLFLTLHPSSTTPAG